MSTSHAVLSSQRVDPRLPVTEGRLLDFPADPIACLRKLHDQHGRVAALKEGSQQIVFVFGPEMNQRVLSNPEAFHSRFFAIRGSRNSSQRRLTSGLMTMNGEELKQHRRVVMGPFQKQQIAGYHERICQLTHDLLKTWKPGQTRDLHEEMTQFMLRVTSAILFGVDRPSFAYRLGAMIDRWVEMNHETGMGALVSDSSIGSRYEDLLSQAEKLETDIKQMIHLRRTSDARCCDVLSLLIRAHDEEGLVSDAELVGHVALLFGAAHLTTAHTLTWTLFLLAQHPSIYSKVCGEIDDVVAESAPTMKEIGRMPLTERVIKESMRVLPASAYSQRIVPKPIDVGPLTLPRGTPVIFSQFITHHLPDLYPDPETFRPERWREISPSAYEYLPFGAGPRMCVGAPLAMMILKTALPTILKRFRLGIVPGAEISGKVISTMLGPTTSVPMLLSLPDRRFGAVPVTGNIHSLVNLPEIPAADLCEVRRAA